ncbi:MAG: Hsp33 family molecular chaperone HslO, partial [Negativicutes bacterium]|nr:Hsp33 family molecular chaperone HslO [Negativicutes bacterium]
MKDHLTKATASGVRAFAAVTTALCEEARRRHDCYPVPAAALGRTMTAALLLAANLKTEEAITVRIAGDGPIGPIVADAGPAGFVRGYVSNPQVELPLNNGKLDVGGAVGQGHIHVTRFTGLKQPFTGSVPLLSGEIGEDVANYLLVSEQTPSTVALGVLVNPDLTVAAAGGFIVQAMPGADDAVLEQVERNLAALPPVSQMVKQGEDGEAILGRIFAGLEATVFEPSQVAFYCQCSDERVESMLVSLGRKELAEMVLEGQAEVRCHFCGELYQIGRERLRQLHDSA